MRHLILTILLTLSCSSANDLCDEYATASRNAATRCGGTSSGNNCDHTIKAESSIEEIYDCIDWLNTASCVEIKKGTRCELKWLHL